MALYHMIFFGAWQRAFLKKRKARWLRTLKVNEVIRIIPEFFQALWRHPIRPVTEHSVLDRVDEKLCSSLVVGSEEVRSPESRREFDRTLSIRRTFIAVEVDSCQATTYMHREEHTRDSPLVTELTQPRNFHVTGATKERFEILLLSGCELRVIFMDSILNHPVDITRIIEEDILHRLAFVLAELERERHVTPSNLVMC